jgi:hypothetical protein
MMRCTLCLVAVGLAACTPEPAEQPAKTITVRSEAQKQLFGLNELNRAIALKRAIHDFGGSCLRITKSGFVGTYKNMDYWTATCEDNFKRTRDWALFIGANDQVQLRLCKDVASVGLPPCVIKETKGAPEPSAPTPQ